MSDASLINTIAKARDKAAVVTIGTEALLNHWPGRYFAVLVASVIAMASVPAAAESPSPIGVDHALATGLNQTDSLAAVARYDYAMLLNEFDKSGVVTLHVRYFVESNIHIAQKEISVSLDPDLGFVFIGELDVELDEEFGKVNCVIEVSQDGTRKRVSSHIVYLTRKDGQLETLTASQYRTLVGATLASKSRMNNPEIGLEPGDVPGEARNAEVARCGKTNTCIQ